MKCADPFRRFFKKKIAASIKATAKIDPITIPAIAPPDKCPDFMFVEAEFVGVDDIVFEGAEGAGVMVPAIEELTAESGFRLEGTGDDVVPAPPA